MRQFVGIAFLAATLVSFLPTPAHPHPGGTDDEGCHHCRSNCDKHDLEKDERHCHGSKESSESKKTPQKTQEAKRTSEGDPFEQPYARVEVYVDKATDGDTIEIRGFPGTQGKRIKVRLLGMDCPESHKNSKCRRDGKQGRMSCAEQIPRGKKAAKRAASLLKHKRVFLEPGTKDGKFDKGGYGRLLAYVRLKDGRDFGLTLVEEGLCSDFGWKYPHSRGEEYKKAQGEANVFELQD